ncbi:MAG: hypothetical protein RL311_150 [Bacteroidota bacterium]|jgi:site-specific DNA-cytosine methylase
MNETLMVVSLFDGMSCLQLALNKAQITKYKYYASDTQRYKMLGNGWTIDVIAHILSYLKTHNP